MSPFWIHMNTWLTNANITLDSLLANGSYYWSPLVPMSWQWWLLLPTTAVLRMHLHVLTTHVSFPQTLISPRTADDDLIWKHDFKYKHDSSFEQLCKRESFEIIWNELFNPVVEIYLPMDNQGLEINFPVTKIHLPWVTGNGNPRTLGSPYWYVMVCKTWGHPITGPMWLTLWYRSMKMAIRRLWKC